MVSPDRQAAAHGARVEPVRLLLFALAYFAGSELGYALSLGPSVGGTFWPPSGISLAAFLTAPAAAWPALVGAGIVANYASDLLHGQVFPASVGFAIANLGEPLLGAFLLRRLFAGPMTFGRLPDLLGLTLVVVVVSTPIAAFVGALTAERYTQNPPGLFAGWATWWVGDAVGAMVLTPFVFRVITGWRNVTAIAHRRWIEAIAFTVLVWAVTDLVFSAPPNSLGMPFLVFPVMLWGSLRLGVIGVGGALCLIVALSTHDTAVGFGPFAAAHLSLGDRLIALQTYVGVMALSFYLLAALWEERARTAEALRLAHTGLEARYRRLVEQSPLAVLAVRRDGLVQDVNPAWRQLWKPLPEPGGDRDARPWRDPRIEGFVRRAFAGEIVEMPEREVDVPGSARPESRRVRGFAYPIKDDTGEVTEVVLIERDITDEVLARQQLVEANSALREREDALSRALEQMAAVQAHREQLLAAERSARADAERASQLKDEFLATLSHELRTPLNAIVGWAQILQQTSTDPGVRRAVETIDRNARAQARLIDDLLDMSRILAGKVGLALAPARLADVVDEAATALKPVAHAKGVTLAVSAGAADETWVTCDAVRLQQVVTNLIDNGIKFTPSGGRVEVHVAARNDEAGLVVRDTGQGIHPDFLATVFERFRQADGSITRRHGGLGLGLSIARQIVEMHGGSIVAESDGPGSGASFTVTLPLAVRAPAAGPEPGGAVRAVSLAGLHVLVVDDNADARELLHRLLEEQGCRVTSASSADEALQALEAAPIDLLLTDIGMPGTDGYELLRRVRTGRHAGVPALAVTAFARREDRERALAAGFQGHIAKPINPAQLLQALARFAPPPRTAGNGPRIDPDTEVLSG